MHEEIDVNTILEPAATRVRDPISGRSIWFSNMIKQPSLQDHTIMFEMHYTPEHTPQMKESIEKHLHAKIVDLGWKGHVSIVGKIQETTPENPSTKTSLPHNKTQKQDPV